MVLLQNFPRIIVKFSDEEGYFLDPSRYREEIFSDDVRRVDEKTLDDWTKSRLSGWARLKGKYPEIVIRRLFTSVAPDRILELASIAKEMDESYRKHEEINLLTYFIVNCPDSYSYAQADSLADDLKLWQIEKDLSEKEKNKKDALKVIEIAYVDWLTALPATSVNPGDDTKYLSDQWYLQGNDKGVIKGINANALWSKDGGNGIKQHFVDFEVAWGLHDDIYPKISLLLLYGKALQAESIGGECKAGAIGLKEHGTNILGLVCALDNTIGMIGVAPGLDFEHNVKTVSCLEDSNSTNGCKYKVNRPNALLKAIDWLPFGGVLLIEVGVTAPESAQSEFVESAIANFPIETLKADFDVIRLATALGLVVVEAAANKGVPIPSDECKLHGLSGAIMVGAAKETVTSYPPYVGYGLSNYGERVNCFAPGAALLTARVMPDPLELETYDDQTPANLYANMSGTSPAAALIAGVALGIQGIIQAKYAARIDGLAMLELLKKDGFDVVCNDGQGNEFIGNFPNLQKIVDKVLPPPSPAFGGFWGTIWKPTMWLWTLIKKLIANWFSLTSDPVVAIKVNPFYDLYCKDNEADDGNPFNALVAGSSDNSPSIVLSEDMTKVSLKVWNRGVFQSPVAQGWIYAWKEPGNCIRLKLDNDVDFVTIDEPVMPGQALEQGKISTSLPLPAWSGTYYLIGVIYHTGAPGKVDHLEINPSEVEEWLKATDADVPPGSAFKNLEAFVRNCNKAAWRKVG